MIRNKQGIIGILLILIVAFAGLIGGYFWLFLTWNYSVGERAGSRSTSARPSSEPARQRAKPTERPNASAAAPGLELRPKR